MSGHWEHFLHDADMGVRGEAATLSGAFEQTALAMMAVVTDLECIRPDSCIEINCDAPEIDILLMEWLNALVYEMATRNMLFSRFSVVIEGNVLVATVCGEAVDVKRHEPAVEVKGATLTELKVQQQENGRWLAQCIVDV